MIFPSLPSQLESKPEVQMGLLSGLPNLGYVAAQFGAEAGKRDVEAASQEPHAGGGAERNQCKNQSIFNQVLTLFSAGQIPKLQIHLD
jgi:hypothetical protein